MMHEGRTLEQIREHYEIETKLASKLRNASRQERRDLYSSLYDELYRQVPHHPQLMQKRSLQDTVAAVSVQMRLVKPFLGRDMTFLEIGPGDCALALEVAKYVRQVYAVDVSDEITRSVTQPANFRLVLSDGISVPVPESSVDVAYSNHLMEHLHPDDAVEQMENIWKALVPGGVYICITPNRLSGPHDISAHFDREATGFHLKEYTVLELSSLFRKVGYLRLRVHVGAKGKYISLHPSPIILLEKSLGRLPYLLRRPVARNLPLRILLGNVRFVGMKPSEVRLGLRPELGQIDNFAQR